MKDLIVIESLSKKYDKTIFRNCNLSIRQGDFVILRGESGSGKTTLTRIIAGLEGYNTGKYTFDGVVLDSKSHRQLINKNKVAIVFQNFNLIEDYSPQENIEMSLIYKGIHAFSMIDHYANLLGVADLKNLDTRVLSGGEKQRFAMIRALISNPDLIIADEPTGNLDQRNAEIVLSLLNHANQQGTTVLLITHNNTPAGLGNRFFRIEGERILETT